MASQLSLRLPTALARELRRRARERGVPASQLLREALSRYLASVAEPAGPDPIRGDPRPARVSEAGLDQLSVPVTRGLADRARRAAQATRQPLDQWAAAAIERALAQPDAVADPLVELAALGAPVSDIGAMLAEIEAGRR